jgi:hypothetical protein
MQIKTVKAADFQEFFEVFQLHRVASHFNNTFRPEALDHSIDMHRADAEGFPKFVLGYRKCEFVIRDKPNRCETGPQLCQQMGQAGRRFPRSQIDYPFSENRCVDDSFTPQSAGKVRPVLKQIVDVTMLYKSHSGGRERYQIVVQPVEEQTVKVRHIASRME